MRVSCLLVSRDPEVQRATAQVFGAIDLHVNEDSLPALELLSRSHFDGFIVDCDGIAQRNAHRRWHPYSRANRKSVIFTIVNGKTSFTVATELGANFVLGKPLDVDRLRRYFQASLHKMETEHRRYSRYQVTVDAEVVCRDAKRFLHKS